MPALVNILNSLDSLSEDTKKMRRPLCTSARPSSRDSTCLLLSSVAKTSYRMMPQVPNERYTVDECVSGAAVSYWSARGADSWCLDASHLHGWMSKATLLMDGLTETQHLRSLCRANLAHAHTHISSTHAHTRTSWAIILSWASPTNNHRWSSRATPPNTLVLRPSEIGESNTPTSFSK